MDSSRFAPRPRRTSLTAARAAGSVAPMQHPTRFDPPKLTGVSSGRIGRPRDDDAALAEAREQGRADALAELAPTIEAHVRATELMDRASSALANALDQIEHADLGLLHDFDRQVLAAAVTLAEQIVGRELRSFDDVVVASVERALTMAPDRGDLVVRVNSSDLAAVLESTTAMGHRGGNVQIVADDSIGHGGCVAQCGSLQIDAQLPGVFARLREAFNS